MIDLKQELLSISLTFYSNPTLPRNIVQNFLNTLINFTSNVFAKYIEEQIQLKRTSYEEKVLEDFKNIVESSKNVFALFNTEYKVFSYYEEKGLLMMPKEHSIGTRFLKETAESITNYKMKDASIQYIPLKWSLKLLLETPGVFDAVTKFVNELETDSPVIANFMQGSLWKEKYSSTNNRKCYPIFVYSNDFEAGNAQGSHAGKNKLGSVYASLPCFPPTFSAQLDNILLVQLFYADDRKYYGNKRTFARLIEDLNDLKHNGLLINVNGELHRVYFQLSLVIGDNLALNEMFGFTESFTCGRPCRICNEPMDSIKINIKEKKESLRTTESYKEDVSRNFPAETGIKEECAFHKVDGFHVCDNLYLDLMHDIFEGTAHYTLLNILHDLIYKNNYFSLEFLNDRLETFQYNRIEKSNRIQPIKKHHIETKGKLKMSVAEMMCFCRYLGLVIGDKVPEDNPAWSLYILLRQIIAILTTPQILQAHISRLDHFIPEFLSQYKELYGELKNKFHNMVHMPRILRNNSPLIYIYGA